MDLKKIKTVEGFSGDGLYKYIVADLSQGDQKKTVLRLAVLPQDVPPAKWIEHHTMRSRLEAEVGSDVKVLVAGGAGMVIDGNFGKLDGIASTELGPDANPDLTVRLLEEKFPGIQFLKSDY